MAIFSRRTIQHLVDENAKLLSRDQTIEPLKRLNKAIEQSLDADWEVV